MIEISDLGKIFLRSHNFKKNKLNSYKSLIKLLIKIQKIKVKNFINLRNLELKYQNIHCLIFTESLIYSSIGT